MKTMLLLAALGATACSKKRPEESTQPPPTAGSDMGSAAGSGSAGSAGSAAAKPLTGEELAKRYDECWSFWNAAKWDDFKACYTADATYDMPGSPMPPVSGADAVVEATKVTKNAFPDGKGEPFLILENGHNTVGLVLFTGTNTGPMKTPTGETPATNQKAGVLIAQALEIDDAGHAKHESDYWDIATLNGQLRSSMSADPGMPVRKALDKAPAKEVVIAKNDDKEKANVAVVQKLVDAFGKHDTKTWGEQLADDAVWSDQADPKDSTKKDVVAQIGQIWKGFSDAKLVVSQTLAAADYVASVGTWEGTNDGDLAAMHLKKTGKKVSVPFLAVYRLDGGKVKNAWLFWQAMAWAQQLAPAPAEPKKTESPKSEPAKKT